MNDPYIDKNTGVLKNILGITDKKVLKQAEADICLPKIITAGKFFSNKYDVDFIKKIHKHIFEDIYPWAGEFRTTPIYKIERVIPGLSLEYTAPKRITKELEDNLETLNCIEWNKLSLDDKAKKFTRLLARIWRIHPFRDGNTRTMMTFAYLYSRDKGFPIDLSVLIPHLTRTVDENGKVINYSIRDKLVLASLDDKDYPEPEHLELVIKKAMISGIKKKEDAERDFME